MEPEQEAKTQILYFTKPLHIADVRCPETGPMDTPTAPDDPTEGLNRH